MERDELAQRIELRQAGGAGEELAVGERRLVADKPPLREREDRVAIERVQRVSGVARLEGQLRQAELRRGVSGGRRLRGGERDAAPDPLAHAACENDGDDRQEHESKSDEDRIADVGGDARRLQPAEKLSQQRTDEAEEALPAAPCT